MESSSIGLHSPLEQGNGCEVSVRDDENVMFYNLEPLLKDNQQTIKDDEHSSFFGENIRTYR